MNTMNNTIGQFLKYEADQRYSRENVTVVSGQNLAAGSVVGKVTVGTTATAAATAGNTGTGAMGEVTVSAGAMAGDYRLAITTVASNAGTFVVTNPHGALVGSGTVAVAFAKGGLAFTLADATDFILGDSFTITVANGSGKIAEYDPAATNGTQTAIGVLIEGVDASSADAPGVIIARHAIVVDKSGLVWKSAMTSGDKDAGMVELKAVGILGRTTV